MCLCGVRVYCFCRDNGGTIQPAAGMLNILRKDLCEQKEQPAEGGVENEWGQELPLPKASTMVCGSNRNSAPVTTANAFQNSGILDPDAIAAFYERAVGMLSLIHISEPTRPY